MSSCAGCGDTWPVAEGPSAIHCGDCPPWRCDRCNKMVDIEAEVNCRICVQRFDEMSMADIKAEFAQIGLSVDVRNDH